MVILDIKQQAGKRDVEGKERRAGRAPTDGGLLICAKHRQITRSSCDVTRYTRPRRRPRGPRGIHDIDTTMTMYDWLATLGLVFGGCCSNAVSLEQLTSHYPTAGSLITFFQFSIISLYGLPKHTIWTPYGPRLAPTRIPISRYLIQVALFYIISLLNNAAFAYQIPMSVHIIFRSGGLIVSMILGWSVVGKKYAFPSAHNTILTDDGA